MFFLVQKISKRVSLIVKILLFPQCRNKTDNNQHLKKVVRFLRLHLFLNLQKKSYIFHKKKSKMFFNPKYFKKGVINFQNFTFTKITK